MYRVCVWLKDNSLEPLIETSDLDRLEKFLEGYFEDPETRFIELYRGGTWLDTVSSLEDVRRALARA